MRGVHGREWPAQIEAAAAGYSIGKWIDEGGTGRYNVLEVETRGFKGPRAYDNSGLPLHKDNQSVIKERIFQDKADPNILYDEMTTIDNALTRPWTATKKYRRVQNPRPFWRESVCAENNPHIEIGGQSYMLSADGQLMPTKNEGRFWRAPASARHDSYREISCRLRRWSSTGEFAVTTSLLRCSPGARSMTPASWLRVPIKRRSNVPRPCVG